MRRFGLKGKFITALIAFTVVLSLLFAVIAAFRMARELDEQFVERGKGLADHIAVEASRLAAIGGRDELQYMLEGVIGTHVLYAQIVQNGKIVAEKKSAPVDLLPATALASSLEIQRGRLTDRTPYLDIKRATGSGYVRLGFSLSYIQYEIGQDILIVSAASVGFIILGTLVAFVLYRAILRPVGQLTGSVRAFSRGTFSARAAVKSGDELEALSDEFNRMADAIVRTKQELEKANRAKSEFLAIMGHELRTPLNALLGYTELLREEIEGRLNAAQKKRLEAITRSGEHLSALIENTLRFAKLEMGEEKLRVEQIDAKEVIQEAIRHVEALALAKKIAIRFTRKSPLPLRADGTKLKQILINLLSNALKYSSERGLVEIQLQRNRDEVRFAVKIGSSTLIVDAQGRSLDRAAIANGIKLTVAEYEIKDGYYKAKRIIIG